MEMLVQDTVSLRSFVDVGGGFGLAQGDAPAGASAKEAPSVVGGGGGSGGAAVARDSVLLVQVQLPILLTRSAASGAWEVAWDEEALLSPKAQIEAMKKTGGGGGGWLSRVQIKWIGLLPIEIPPEEEEAVRQKLEPMGCIPVFIEHTTLLAFRDGYCKGTLWPVFHNVMDVYGEIPTRWWHKGQQSDRWKAYTDANARFAATVVETWHEGDLVWLHVRWRFLREGGGWGVLRMRAATLPYL